ncbi:MAG: EAL domain-containing protein [Brevinematales bacterium]|nr:EAL domain-containing protein [Brevinematales bacterium]
MNKKLDLNVLYAEDESLIRIEVEEMLKQIANNVFVVEDGEKALQIFKDVHIDVIITDIRMPKMDGLALSREVRKINPTIPIIITTAYSDAEYLLESLEIGINQYIVKPIYIDKILESLNKIYEVKVLNKKLESTRNILSEYKNAIDLISIVFKTDPFGYIQYVNDAFCNTFQVCRENIIGKYLNEILKIKNENFDFETIKNTISKEERWIKTVEFSESNKEEENIYIHFIGLPITDSDTDEIFEYIFVGNNITDTVKKEKALLKQIYTDNLTGLPNRVKLINDLSDSEFGYLMIINIDSFREINDFYGVVVGDFILKEIAHRLLIYENDRKYKTYKLSSDEYAVLVQDKISKEEAYECAEFIRNVITEEKYRYDDNIIYISVTIGMSSGEIEKNDEYLPVRQNILLKADMALKKAKSLKKAILIYDESFNIFQEFQNNILWTKKLKDAISSDRIIPFYQPIFNNKTGKIEKYESLVRIIGENGEIVSPIHFLHISKKNRLYEYITRKMLEKIVNDFEKLSYEVSFNLSIEDINNLETRKYIIYLIKSNKEFSKKLVVELTETEEIDNYEIVNEFIQELKNYNVKIAIDDFGSGYSNFDHIIRLNVDYLKIDASIIKNLSNNKNSQILTKFIVDFAKSMYINTIAEFVSTKEIYEKVIELGVDYSQGYYLGEPKPFNLINTQ